jgi:hypothetical protein
MRDRAEKPLLAGDQRLDSFGHPVEVLAKHTNFIATFVHRLRNSGAKVAIRDLACRFAQLDHRSRDVTRKPKAEDTRNQHHRT